MKSFKSLVALGAMLVATISAQAQFNLFSEPRTLAIVYPQALNAGSTSNFIADIHGFEGVAKIDIITLTNGVCSAATLNIYTSSDQTNWTALSNYAVATSNNVIYTNVYYSGLLYGTNIWMYPGTVTTPTASTAGFATKYILPAPFTNNGSITLSTGLKTIGFIVPDASRYITFSYSFTGSSTNTVAAIFTGRKQQE